MSIYFLLLDLGLIFLGFYLFTFKSIGYVFLCAVRQKNTIGIMTIIGI